VQAEEELRKANRALKVLSECNQAVVRATEEPGLLHQICRLIAQVGGYRLAWVGFAERDEEKTVRPVAHAGFEEGYLETLNITWADTESGRGPTGTAIRSGEYCAARDILTDPHFAIWREAAIQRGYASSIALPLIAEGQTFGALNIYAAEPDAFDADEVKLLTGNWQTTWRMASWHCALALSASKRRMRCGRVRNGIAPSSSTRLTWSAVSSPTAHSPL